MQFVNNAELIRCIHQQWQEGSPIDLADVHCSTPHFTLQMQDHSPVDISQGNYTGFFIAHATFSNVNFQSSQMQGATFKECTFFECDFSFIQGDGITYDTCIFVNATFHGAMMVAALFDGSRFYSTCFDHANLYGAQMNDVSITGCFPREIVSHMVDAVEENTLKGKNPFTLPDSTAAQADMRAIVAHRAVLALDLRTANLVGADLTDAYIAGSGLTLAHLSSEQWASCCFTDARKEEPIKEQIRLFPSFGEQEVGNALVTDLVDGETEQAVTPAQFIEMVKPYWQRAKEEHLDLVFHVFTTGANRWIAHTAEAWQVYQGWVAKGQPSRLWVELYSDRANDEKAHEDCLLSYKEFPF